LASEEVYALNSVPLLQGINLVALHGEPYTNTFRALFGTDPEFWPATDRFGDCTRIDFFTTGTKAVAKGDDCYWFGVDENQQPNWYWHHKVSTTVTNENQPPTEQVKTVDEIVTDREFPAEMFSRGFSITLPELDSSHATMTTEVNGEIYSGMVWNPILRVPTNGPAGRDYFEETVTYGGRREGHCYTLVSLNLPVAAHVSRMNLLECGFQPGNGVNTGDMIYTYDNEKKAIRQDSIIYFDGSYDAETGKWNGSWKNKMGSGLVFRPNDVIVIVSCGAPAGKQAGDTWTWRYRPLDFYQAPTRWMGW